jgi:hypothetical protein
MRLALGTELWRLMIGVFARRRVPLVLWAPSGKRPLDAAGGGVGRSPGL